MWWGLRWKINNLNAFRSRLRTYKSSLLHLSSSLFSLVYNTFHLLHSILQSLNPSSWLEWCRPLSPFSSTPSHPYSLLQVMTCILLALGWCWCWRQTVFSITASRHTTRSNEHPSFPISHKQYICSRQTRPSNLFPVFLSVSAMLWFQHAPLSSWCLDLNLNDHNS